MKKTNRSQVRLSGKRVQVFKSEANLGSARLRAIPFALAIAFGSSSSFADPAGVVVAAGQAAISSANGITTIQQMSDRAVVNWQSFNVNAGEAVKFVQPSSTAAILNRVTGGSVSNINGLVEGNGRVYLINPNGIVVGANGVVNVNGGFVASTKSLADNAFMSGGALVFTGESTGSIQILGKVQSAQGDVILIAPKIAIEKTGSLIAGQTIKLVAANEVELSNGKFTVKPKAGDAGQLTVEGALEAAKVQLAANNNNLGALAINTTGTIRATGTQTNPDGSVSIIATGEGGNINISGNIRSEKGDGNGGAITVLADNAIRVSGTIDANSTDAAKKGGDIIIGRDVKTGKLAKATDVSGATLLSNKGFVETSGDWLATYGTRVKAKDWLLDPYNISIVSSGASGQGGYSNTTPGTAGPDINYIPSATSTILNTDIQNSLNDGTNVKITTGLAGSSGSDDGNITVNAAIVKSGSNDATLTLEAYNGITVNQNIGKASGDNTSTGKLHVTMTAKGLATNSQGLVINKSIDANGGAISLTGNTSNTVAAVTVASSALIKGANVTLDGTSTGGFAVNGSGNITATGKVVIKGVSGNTGGYAVTTNNAINAADDIEITATGTAKHGIWLGSNVTGADITSTGGKITIDSDITQTAGALPGSGSGAAVTGRAIIKAEKDITIKGKTLGYYAINGLNDVTSTTGNIWVDGYSRDSQGVVLSNMLTAKNGKVDLIGTSGGPGTTGVNINATNAGIEAQSYNVQGVAASGNGVLLGTGTFKSTSTTVDSVIEGKTTTGGIGLKATAGTLNFDSGARKAFVRNTSDSNGGVELRDGSVIKTKGDVTFGRNENGKSSLFLQGLRATADGGKLTFLGNSSSTNGIGFQDYGGVAVDVLGNNGAKIVIDGKSTANGYAGVNMKMVAYVVHSVTSNGAGGSIDIIGNSTLGRGVGVDIAKITANDGNVINITGNGGTAVVTPAGIPAVGEGVYIANAVTANGGGNIKIEGTASGAGAAVFINSNGGMGAVTANGVPAAGINPAIPAGKVTIKGDANFSIGINNSAAITGGTVEMTGTSTGNNAIYTTGAIKSTVDDVTITGTNNGTSTALSLQGAITANQNVVIEGTNTNATNAAAAVYMNKTATATNGGITVTGTAAKGVGVTLIGALSAEKDIIVDGTSSQTASVGQGVLIQNEIKSNAGNITVTGVTNAANQPAVSLYFNGTTSNGSLKTFAANKNININADTLYIDTKASVDAGSTGVVTIQTTSGNQIKLGAQDAKDSNPANRVLGLDNGELGRITAGKTIIGSSTGGDITVSGSIDTTNQSNGNIELISGGYIAVNAALTVGDATATKNLTLNGAGASSAISQTAAIKAAGLELLGANATHTLTDTGNQVTTLAGNSKAINYVNGSALTLGAVNATTGITATGDVSIATQTGNLTIAENVSTTATTATALVLNAGKSSGVVAAVGADAGGNILVNTGKTVTVGSGGIAQLMTGSISGSTSAASLASAGHFRYNSDEINTNYTAPLGSGINVIYREKPLVTLKVDDVIKLYNGLAFNGGSVSRFSGSYSGANGDSAFAISRAAKFAGNAQGAINVSPTAYVISAAEDGKSALGYDVTYESGSLMITYSGVNKAPTPRETYTRIAGDVVNLAPVSFAVGVAPATAAGDEADPNICYAWGQRDSGSVIVHTVLKPSYLGLRHVKTDTQEAMSNSGGSSSHSASPCGKDFATNLAEANSL